jgi:hypothetical protein
MTEVQDYVLFQFPKARDLQWAAVSVMQNFVNHYKAKMAARHNDVSQGKAIWKLHYNVVIPTEDWTIFEQMKVNLTQLPEPLYEPDMVVEMSEDRLTRFTPSLKHVTQLFGILCGVECFPLPDVRELKHSFTGKWVVINPDDQLGEIAAKHGWDVIDTAYLLNTTVFPWKGCVGDASWETYAAASMLLCAGCRERIFQMNPKARCQGCGPVVEIHREKPPYNITKYANSAYRLVQGAGWVPQVDQAIDDLELVLQKQAMLQRRM